MSISDLSYFHQECGHVLTIRPPTSLPDNMPTHIDFRPGDYFAKEDRKLRRGTCVHISSSAFARAREAVGVGMVIGHQDFNIDRLIVAMDTPSDVDENRQLAVNTTKAIKLHIIGREYLAPELDRVERDVTHYGLPKQMPVYTTSSLTPRNLLSGLKMNISLNASSFGACKVWSTPQG